MVAQKKPLYEKPFHCSLHENLPHLNLWSNLINNMKTWKFKNRKNNEIQDSRHCPYVKCHKGWMLTLTSLSMLYDELKQQKFEYLMTKRLNQDCLENFFSCIRGTGGHRTHPTAYELQNSFCVICVNSWVQLSKSQNCENDGDDFIINLINCRDGDDINKHIQQDIIADESDDIFFQSHIQKFSYGEQNVLAYLSGYIAKRVLEDITCSNCVDILVDRKKN